MKTILRKEILGLVEGRVLLEEPLSRHTTFKIGGQVDFWIEPESITELNRVLVYCKVNNVPFYCIGGGSNILVKDDGLRGIATHLAAPFFKAIDIEGTKVKAGSGVLLPVLVKECVDHGLAGLEFLAGIPGTLGGAIAMNAGMPRGGMAISDLVESVSCIDLDGKITKMMRKDIAFSYRSSGLKNVVITGATLGLKKSDKDKCLSEYKKYLEIKKENQALDEPSCGSVFKNPGFGLAAWKLIDSAGLRGMTQGGAQVSNKHANYIINKNGASFDDVSRLINMIKQKVFEKHNIELEQEVIIL